MLLVQRKDQFALLNKTLKINLNNINFSHLSFERASELKLAWEVVDFKTLILSLPDLETAECFLRKFGHGIRGRYAGCTYQIFENGIAQDQCSMHSKALSSKDLATLAYRVVFLLSELDREERLTETESLWKKKFIIQHFQSITKNPVCDRSTLDWKGDPIENSVKCLLYGDFPAFLTFLPRLSPFSKEKFL